MSTDEKQEAVRADDPAQGMTIRERFAMAAMQGILANYGILGEISKESGDLEDNVSSFAVGLSDALLAALEARHVGE